MVIVQEADGASDPPHVLTCVNEEGLEPVMDMLVMVSVAPPVLVSVVACCDVPPTCTDPKDRVDGENCTVGEVPVPVKGTVCGELGALSAKETVALLAPTPVGVNVTPRVQFAPAARVAPQVLEPTGI
jgi:hypothetical protein